MELARTCPIDVALSGHVHQFRVLDLDATRHVWAPTTWAVLTEQRQPTLGQKRCGLLELTLDARGASAPVLGEPDGLRQLMLGVTVADPFHDP